MDVPTVSVDEVADPAADGWVVLDVREPWEWASGHIEGAVHIPLEELEARLSQLPKDKLIAAYCT